MTKQVACPVCKGNGFVSVIGENSTWSHTCDHCNGAGEIEIPMTNADRIRAMSDEELAESLSKTIVDAMCYSHSGGKSVDKLPKEIWEELVKEYLEWLKQPADENGNADKCVSCGEIIPEGRQVCPNCERGVTDG